MGVLATVIAVPVLLAALALRTWSRTDDFKDRFRRAP